MTRPLFLLLFFALASFAQSSGCFRFFPGSFKVIDGHPAYAVAKNRFVSLRAPKKYKTLMEDPFRGLVLFEAESGRPFILVEGKSPLTYCPSDGRKVKVLSTPVAVWPGRLKGEVEGEGALFGSCCKLAGLVTQEGGWFDAEAIRRLMRGDIYHGDIGVRWKRIREGAVVESVDPWSGLALREGDRLLSVGKKKRASWCDFWERVDACRPGGHVTLGVLRDGKALHITAGCYGRMGGGRVSDTFLERFGLRFAKDLTILWADPSKKAYKAGLRAGDRLIMIDETPVKSDKDVRVVLSRLHEKGRMPRRMLWDRNDFQFFLLLTAP
ncbi:PDZ domain-containing protein [Hydrogenimonas sp. SS33]|uniref:PDZ domain-containing protein n=1 Tax=Hydrogenimonas leucolamina TaxID=2954236 RepID=UPI00336BBCF5